MLIIILVIVVIKLNRIGCYTGNTVTVYSGGACVECLRDTGLSSLRLFIVFQSLLENSGKVPHLCNCRILSNPFCSLNVILPLTAA
jgi:hypothetical protein